MNKVNSKSKGCANKKCSPSTHQNGAQVKDPGPPPDTNNLKRDIEELKVKGKPVNGLVNGRIVDDEKIISNKTETNTSREKVEDNNHISLETNSSAAPEKTAKKSKSKKRNKTTCEPHKSCNFESECSEGDFLVFLRAKLEEASLKDDKLKEVTSGLSTLDVNKEEVKESEEELPPRVENPEIKYVAYESELQMPLIMKIIQKDLSEPYSIYTYRYFIHNWPNLCFLAMCEEICVGAIVCKLDMHRKVIKRGYIAMLAVDKRYRKHGIGSTLVRRAIQEMISGNADEVVLETEITNKPALRLYEALGFVRDKRLFRYYLNGVDALRLKLWLR